MDWRLGAQWFQACLLDHDWAVNGVAWAYVAGVGHDPRDRIFRTVSQGLQYDPGAALVAAWVPELARLPPPLAHAPWAASEWELADAGVHLVEGPGPDASKNTYPLPMVDPDTQLRRDSRAS